MSSSNLNTRNVIKQYDKQLSAARDLAKKKGVLDEHELEGVVKANIAEDIAKEQNKNRKLAKRIAREIYDNLLFTDSQNPLVQEIFGELTRRYGDSFIFSQIPSKLGVDIIFKNVDLQLSATQKEEILTYLWELTLAKVEGTIVDRPWEVTMDIKTLFGQSNLMQQVNKLDKSQQYNKVENEAPKATFSRQGDTVKLSSEGALRTEAHKHAMLAPDIRQEKVQNIKERLLAGEYKIDSKNIARKMLQMESAIMERSN